MIGVPGPWWLIGAGVTTLGAFGLGAYLNGDRVQAKFDAYKATMGKNAAEFRATEIKEAMATSLDIAGILRDGFASIAKGRERTKAIVQETKHAVDQTPSMAERQPADVVRLRREQSDESARIEADTRRGARKRP